MQLIKEYTLPQCLEGMLRHRSREAYAILGQGLWLLKAAQKYAAPPAQRGQGRKSIPTVGIDSPQENEGFVQWLRENVAGPECALRISLGTCYNYMAAAKAMGLTADSDEDDLAQLEAANALGDRRLTDLYKLGAGEGAGPKTPPSLTPPESAPDTLWRDFELTLLETFAPESKTMRALYVLPPQKLEELETQVRTALDRIKEVKKDRTLR